MNPMLKNLLGSLLRKALTALSVYLTTKRALTAEEGQTFVDMALPYLLDQIPLLISAGWSYLNQHGWRKMLLTALTQEPGTTEDEVKAIIKSGTVTPTVTTPSNTVPGVPDKTP